MYVPRHFAMADQAVTELLSNIGAGNLVTASDSGLRATMLPLLFEPAVGERGALLGHVARNNDQWRQQPIGDALVILDGPDGYVSPSWYPSKRRHGRVVPTWNYVTAHVYGELVVHDDVTWLDSLVRRQTEKYEAGNGHPWHVDDAPPAYVAGQLRAIVGVEIRISRVEAKAKLSQNRDEGDVTGVIEGLERRGDTALARAMRDEAGARSGDAG